MKEIVNYLMKSGKYGKLLANWNRQNADEIGFEVLFAYWCESRGLSLSYEVNVNPENDKTVDFNFVTDNDVTINLELVRPDLNEEIRNQLSGDVLQSYNLTSNHKDPGFRTSAQIIKLQWGLLKKVEKFPSLSQKAINIIVADCSNVHAGMFDYHDLGMTMYGYPGNPVWQEYWEGKKLLGMWEKGYDQRGSKIFCETISAVIVVPEQKPELLEKAMTALNPSNSKEHRQLILDELSKYKSFVDVQVVQ